LFVPWANWKPLESCGQRCNPIYFSTLAPMLGQGKAGDKGRGQGWEKVGPGPGITSGENLDSRIWW
jgi:hypothetical protein